MKAGRWLVAVLWLLGCSDGSDGDASGSDAGGASGTSAPPAQACPATATHVVDLTLEAGDFMQENVASGSAVECSLVATPSIELLAVAPGDSIAVNVRLGDEGLSVVRDGRALYVSARFAQSGTTFAQAPLQTEVRSTATRTFGAWQSSVSTNAGGAPRAIVLGATSINPSAGDVVECVSLRAELPASVNRVDDSTLLDVVPSAALPLEELRLGLTADAPLEPCGLELTPR
jgi:hypothetical protein